MKPNRDKEEDIKAREYGIKIGELQAQAKPNGDKEKNWEDVWGEKYPRFYKAQVKFICSLLQQERKKLLDKWEMAITYSQAKGHYLDRHIMLNHLNKAKNE